MLRALLDDNEKKWVVENQINREISLRKPFKELRACNNKIAIIKRASELSYLFSNVNIFNNLYFLEKQTYLMDLEKLKWIRSMCCGIMHYYKIFVFIFF